MDRDPRATELANLKDAIANFEHQLDLFDARMGYPSKPPPAHEPVTNDAQIAFANDVVAAMKNRRIEHFGMADQRQGQLL
jgi:hypothetical protein